MNDIINGLKEMDTTTLAILGFAALLLIFLLVLIIITIKVLRSGGEVPDKRSSYDDDEEDEYTYTDYKVRMIGYNEGNFACGTAWTDGYKYTARDTIGATQVILKDWD